MAICDICGEEHFEATKSCGACNKVVSKYKNKTKYSMEKVRKALTHAYSQKDTDNNESYFKCEYTKIKSKFNNKKETLGTSKDALVLTLDHKNSGDEELIVSLNIINKMKGDIPHNEFKDFVMTLGSHFKKDDEESVKEVEKILKLISVLVKG